MTKKTTYPAVLFLFLALAVHLPQDAAAGDRKLEVLLVQVGGETDEEDACFRRIRRPITDGYTLVTWATDDQVAEQFGLDISEFLLQWLR